MNYYDVLRFMHGRLRPRVYVEIGVRTGESFRLAPRGALAIGVDPFADITCSLDHLNVRLFQATSDKSFETGLVDSALKSRPIDVALIDGMHHFDAVLRDFANIEQRCSAGSVVLLHDTVPVNRRGALREQTVRLWSGDVWKAVVGLRRHRPDLRIATIAVAPTGLTVITNVNPGCEFAPQLESIGNELMSLDYEWLERNPAERLALTSCRRKDILRMLPAPFRPTSKSVQWTLNLEWSAKAFAEHMLLLKHLRPIYWKARETGVGDEFRA